MSREEKTTIQQRIEQAKKPVYRKCPHCERNVPLGYNFNEHKRLCKRYYAHEPNQEEG